MKDEVQVFRCPPNERRELYNHVKESGWQVLGESTHELTGEILMNCVKKTDFLDQSADTQLRLLKVQEEMIELLKAENKRLIEIIRSDWECKKEVVRQVRGNADENIR